MFASLPRVSSVVVLVPADAYSQPYSFCSSFRTLPMHARYHQTKSLNRARLHYHGIMGASSFIAAHAHAKQGTDAQSKRQQAALLGRLCASTTSRDGG